MSLDEPRPCPEPEILAAYLDGTLDAAARGEISAHVAGCNHCLYVLREAGAHQREASPAAAQWRRYLPIAAALMIVVTATILVRYRGDPVRRMAAASHDAGVRTFEGRLAGFDYDRYSSTRSMAAGIPLISEAANQVLRQKPSPHSAKEWHAKGIANLLVERMDRAIGDLAEAVRLAPRSAAYRSDLATARIALGIARRDREELRRALADTEEALRLSPHLPEAMFNRAVALDRLGESNAAHKAFADYLALDPSSSWAEEARWRMNRVER